jgi:hypothetical protein
MTSPPVGAAAELTALWEHIYGGEQGTLALFSANRAADGSLMEVSTDYRLFPMDIDVAVQVVAREAAAGREVWHCAHLLTHRPRVKENATRVWCVWSDDDGARAPAYLPPTAQVQTSRGRTQSYWRLTDAVAPEQAEDLNRRLAAAIGSDPSGVDLTQLLRAPGTANKKYSDRPPVRLLYVHPERVYDPAELDRLLPPVPERNGHRPGTAPGERIPVGERNGTLTSLAGTMRRRGMSGEAIAAALHADNAARCDPPLADSEVAGIARSIARYPADSVPGRKSSSSSSKGSDDDYFQDGPQRRPRVVTLAALRQRYSAEIDWLVPGYIARRELTMLVAPPESYKSWAMADLTRAVLTEGHWLSHFPVPKGGVVYVEQERAGNLVYQLDLLARAYACDVDHLWVMPPDGFRLEDPGSRAALGALVREHHPLLVVINSFRSVYSGHPGDGVDTARALGWVGQLAEQEGPAIVVVDGTNKHGGIGLVRGMAAHSDSLQKEYEADCVLHLERDRDAVGRGTGPARLYVGKRRAGTAGEPFSFDVVPHHPAGARVVWQESVPLDRRAGAAAVTSADRVAAALEAATAPVDLQTLADRTGLALGTVKNVLPVLRATGRAERAARGLWGKSSSSFPYSDDDDDFAGGLLVFPERNGTDDSGGE